MKNFYSFLVVIVYIFATIGSIAYLFYFGKPQFAVANCILALMAAPYAYKHLKKMLD